MDNPENFEFIHDSNIAFKRKGIKGPSAFKSWTTLFQADEATAIGAL